jgi:hypothetical protein
VRAVRRRRGCRRRGHRSRRAGTVTLNGRQAFVFESKQAVPLSEVPAEDDYPSRSRRTVRRARRPAIKLPFAQPATTKFDDHRTARGCSEIFVYL